MFLSYQKNLIKSGAAGVHFEDQLASEKKMWSHGGESFSSNRYNDKKFKKLQD